MDVVAALTVRRKGWVRSFDTDEDAIAKEIARRAGYSGIRPKATSAPRRSWDGIAVRRLSPVEG
jgi:hypothetical protein